MKRLAFGIPYARQNSDGSVICPRCGERIQLTHRKDFESFSVVEYQDHYYAQHAEADGLVQIDGLWYEDA